MPVSSHHVEAGQPVPGQHVEGEQPQLGQHVQGEQPVPGENLEGDQPVPDHHMEEEQQLPDFTASVMDAAGNIVAEVTDHPHFMDDDGLIELETEGSGLLGILQLIARIFSKTPQTLGGGGGGVPVCKESNSESDDLF